MMDTTMTDTLVPYWIDVRDAGGASHLEMRWTTPADLAALRNHDAA